MFNLYSLSDASTQQADVTKIHCRTLIRSDDQVIVLYKGRVLDKGRFTALHEKGVIS